MKKILPIIALGATVGFIAPVMAEWKTTDIQEVSSLVQEEMTLRINAKGSNLSENNKAAGTQMFWAALVNDDKNTIDYAVNEIAILIDSSRAKFNGDTLDLKSTDGSNSIAHLKVIHPGYTLNETGDETKQRYVYNSNLNRNATSSGITIVTTTDIVDTGYYKLKFHAQTSRN